MTRSLVLAAMLATLAPGAAAAQNCSDYPPGASRFSCMSAKHPGLIAKRERCLQEAASMGLRPGVGKGSFKAFVVACMQRGRR
jgi:hypothetical protein